MIDIGKDYITIYDHEGTELVHWVEDEWIEDPEVVISIANAIHLFYTKGEAYLIDLLTP